MAFDEDNVFVMIVNIKKMDAKAMEYLVIVSSLYIIFKSKYCANLISGV